MHTFYSKTIITLILASGIFLVSSNRYVFEQALAHSGATGIVKERMDTMKSISAAMKRVGKMRGGENFDADVIVAAMQVIIEKSEKIRHQYPEGEFSKPSEALPKIREEWEKFVALTDEMKTLADEIKANAIEAETYADVKPAFVDLSGTCKSCHEQFRLKH